MKGEEKRGGLTCNLGGAVRVGSDDVTPRPCVRKTFLRILGVRGQVDERFNSRGVWLHLRLAEPGITT